MQTFLFLSIPDHFLLLFPPMKSVFGWLGKAANYVANSSLGRVALASQLAFLNRYLERPIHPDQISTAEKVVLSDLCFNVKVPLPIFDSLKSLRNSIPVQNI